MHRVARNFEYGQHRREGNHLRHEQFPERMMQTQDWQQMCSQR